MSAQTSLFIFTLLVACALGSYKWSKYEPQLEKAEYPQNITATETLKEFIRLVDKHNLNVSLILSTAKNFESDNLKEALAMTFTFPVNQESVTKATLDKEAFKKLAEVANKEKLTVGGGLSTNNVLKVISNNKKGLPITKAYKIFTGIKNGKTGFVFDEENYVAQYTFVTPGADGKNQTTKVFYGDVDVEVVDKSESAKDDVVTTIKKALITALFTYDEDLIPKAVTTLLGKQLPEHNWDAASQVGDNNYIESDLWVEFTFLGDKYLVYAS